MTPFTAHLDDVRAALGEQAWQKARDGARRSTSMPRSGSRSIVRQETAFSG
jgi:hypothetical protein